MFLTFFFEPFLVGKVMKENLLRKVRKSEKRKVKNIRKVRCFLIKGHFMKDSYDIGGGTHLFFCPFCPSDLRKQK